MVARTNAWRFWSASRKAGLGLMAAGLMGCAALEDEPNYPVTLSPGFTLPEYLAEPRMTIDQAALGAMLETPWNQEIEVVNSRSSGSTLLATCRDYLEEATAKTRAVNPEQQQTLVEVGAMCWAAEWLSGAEGANRSNIPDVFIDQTLPERLPPEVALQAPGATPSGAAQYWSDLNPGYASDVIGRNLAVYQHSAGSQRLSLIGRGDLNGDGEEDVLISSADQLEGENDFKIRLFALTVNDDREWQLVQNQQP